MRSLRLLGIVIAGLALSAPQVVADPGRDESGNRRASRGYYDAGERGRGERVRREARIPRGHLPPPGECRRWIRGLPPGQQPPPYRC
jgi:hypothetical protein